VREEAKNVLKEDPTLKKWPLFYLTFKDFVKKSKEA